MLEHNPRARARAAARCRRTCARACERLQVCLSARTTAPASCRSSSSRRRSSTRCCEPTFVYAYPMEVSPLSRANDADPFVTDRFELFIGGRELANGFSELNDPEDQAARFRAQVARKDAGDDEAMHYDADYIRALEYGMPPTARAGRRHRPAGDAVRPIRPRSAMCCCSRICVRKPDLHRSGRMLHAHQGGLSA